MSKIRSSARGQECQIRLEGICNGDTETTVLCHLNGGGMGKKQGDIFAAYGCSSCHKTVDKLPNLLNCISFKDIETLCMFYEGVFRTQRILLEKGLITVKGMK